MTDRKASPRSAPRSKAPPAPPRRSLLRRALRLVLRGVLGVAAFFVALVLLFAVVNPPTTIYMWQEGQRLGGVEQDWADWDEIAPVVARSVVAAEDANYCLHWGFDMAAIRQALDEGGNRGASTLTQQVVKNVFLWHGRNWFRKSAEAVLTPLVELVWSKRRILEVYLNVAEFGEGVFGIRAAAARHFGVEPADLTAVQAARLAAILPDPKGRDPVNPSSFVRGRSRAALGGAETILADGRAACFEG
ncbi:monofunctional biosynthetic peptidoglycan transglycosylase [Fertoebacter nigrum]|uniref:Biosynthetic peptidoglycan transglycosylase n=1 Tax=Fertoeibacter niger TaxID=2656921 RepID=A0A8X8H2W9_9RHOB|nr:monofunctional biosynthetic peptidoglycan transglycosylase [Fertoeibacter niger]NUB45212.1 monofunctional biosynthetic peptidoglycan transglycosylase [Fertoeibacter niger]